MRKPALLAIACVVLVGSLNCLAADRKTLADLPAEAQASIRAALLRDSAIPDLTINDYTLTASDGVNLADFGASVAIDGNIVVVGATQDLSFGKGSVYVFVKPQTGWANMTQTAELSASDGQIGDGLGCSVGISGSTIVAGACEATVNGNAAEGAGYVFVEPPSGWANMTETAKLTASDGVNAAYFGTAVSISGNAVAVGAPRYSAANPGAGSAYVFVEPRDGWSDMTETAELTASNGAPYDYFGWSVSVSSDTAIVGGGQCSSCPGTAYVFAEPAGGWMNTTETAQLTPSNGDGQEEFGLAVSVSGDTVAVGDSTHGFETGGAIYVFVEPSGGWKSMTQTAMLDVTPNKFGCLGWSVSISGSVILAGDQCANGNTGASYAFVRPRGGWQNASRYSLRLLMPGAKKGAYFGAATAISGKTGIVGTPEYRTVGPGEAFIFTPQ